MKTNPWSVLRDQKYCSNDKTSLNKQMPLAVGQECTRSSGIQCCHDLALDEAIAGFSLWNYSQWRIKLMNPQDSKLCFYRANYGRKIRSNLS